MNNLPILPSTSSPYTAWEMIRHLPEARLWLPVCAQSDSKIQHAHLLGLDLVIWQTSKQSIDTSPLSAIQTQWHAAIDQCPHRGAALSLGCIVQEQLQCPYHAWQFNSEGQCTKIPAVPAFNPPLTHGLTVFQTYCFAGLVWVQLIADTTIPTPDQLHPEHTQLIGKSGFLNVLTQAYSVQTSAPRVVENFLDISHFGCVHEDWLGDLEHLNVLPHQVQLFENRAQAKGVRAWQPKSQTTLDQSAWVDYQYEVAHPFCAQLSKLPDRSKFPNALHESIAVWAAPLSQTQTIVWFSLCMADIGQTVEDVQAFQHTIFSQDKPVLESQRPKCLPLEQGLEKHSAADKMSAAYRQLLKRWNISYGVTHTT